MVVPYVLIALVISVIALAVVWVGYGGRRRGPVVLRGGTWEGEEFELPPLVTVLRMPNQTDDTVTEVYVDSGETDGGRRAFALDETAH